MGEVATASWTSMNGSQLGDSGSVGYNGVVFEPIDEYKGDIARIFFYMAVRYEAEIADWETLSSNGDDALNGDAFSVYEDWFRDQMLAWHAADPVSQVEIDRNNAIYAIQGNRNPFVDIPTLTNDIWGPVCFGILPVELIAFTANGTEKGVELKWETASEINNDYYDLQHSTDGINFQTIHQAKGFLNSIENKSYSYVHTQPSNGDNYYRLQQVDLDGKRNSISTRVVTFKTAKEIRLFPNPVQDQLQIIQSDPLLTQVVIKNILGATLQQLEFNSSQSTIDLSGLSTGTYLFELWQNGQVLKTERVVKF